ncbi:MAG: DUF349 domain-containing protein [Muribaculaceae bacterium]|nr:DUF349 domain-containing protein [Muribaculaceae bacterium]
MEMPEEALEPVVETNVAVEETEAKPRVHYSTVEEVLEAARQLSERDADEITREELSSLKQQFYAFRRSDAEPAEAAETPAQPVNDAIDSDFKAILEVIKEKKALRLAQVEAQRAANLARREEIIGQMLEMSADADNVNREFPRFKELQQQFKETGEVPATESTAQWKRYQDAVEHFYDQYRINKDLRDYDFRKNLDTKTVICEEAESLANEDDVVLAFKRLQVLHDTWRDTGPVAKELRDDLWNRFKDASAVVNKRYQTFFEERKAREQQNEDAKTALCERVEAIDLTALTSFKQWDEQTAAILAAQEEWRTLGYASHRVNNKLFARFREACDRFFTTKAEFYKAARDRQADNLARKTALCEEAESLKDSTDWRRTADRLVELQRQWKTIGAVPRKQSDTLWTRFQQACDYFFEQKKKDLSDLRSGEQAALKAKRDIIARLKDVADDTPADEVNALLRQADTDWRQAGHVPFRDKDKVYDEYRATVNTLRDRFKLSRSSRSMARFENTLADIANDTAKLSRERERILRAYEAKRQELKTCENNLGFFTTKSGRGNAMIAEMERRIAGIKEEIQTLAAKIEMLDNA